MAPNILPIVIRVSWIGVLIMSVVYAAYSTKQVSDTPEGMIPYGGLSGLLTCVNGWDWHVVLLTVGFVVAMVESVLAYRAPLLEMPGTYMWVHLFWQTVSLVCIVVGMVAIIHSKLCGGYQHMYSVHAWTSTIVLLLFVLQYAVGFVFLLAGEKLVSLKTRQFIVDSHKYLGRIVFFGGIAACVNGWADIQMMNVDSGQYNYKGATMLGSASAILLWVIGAAMAAILFRSDFPTRGSIPSKDTSPISKQSAVPV